MVSGMDRRVSVITYLAFLNGHCACNIFSRSGVRYTSCGGLVGAVCLELSTRIIFGLLGHMLVYRIITGGFLDVLERIFRTFGQI